MTNFQLLRSNARAEKFYSPLSPRGRGLGRGGSWQDGFVPLPLIAVGIIVLLGVVAFVLFNRLQTNRNAGPSLPPGIVTDSKGNICETQDPNYCHETPDIETWKDDGFD